MKEKGEKVEKRSENNHARLPGLVFKMKKWWYKSDL